MILDIGFNNTDVGFDGASCDLINAIGKQAPDIVMCVDGAGEKSLELATKV